MRTSRSTGCKIQDYKLPASKSYVCFSSNDWKVLSAHNLLNRIMCLFPKQLRMMWSFIFAWLALLFVFLLVSLLLYESIYFSITW